MSDGGAPQEIETLQGHTDTYIRHVLRLYDGNVTKAAKALHIGRASLYRWLKGGDSKVCGSPNREALANRERAALRTKVLQEVLTEWQSTSNNGKFTQWLMKQLSEAAGKQ